ncbi:MAG: hypothetical protein ABFS41_01430 [Myxococcota bacterium]
MGRFDYEGFPVRDEIRQLHAGSWEGIARAGSHWSGAERVEIARQARAARAARGEPPWLRTRLPDADGRLPADAVDAARTIAADAHRIDAAWAAKKIAALGDAAYVELASVVVTVTAIDAFGEALGTAHAALPEPEPGAPDGARLEDAADAGAYVPMLDPFVGPNVGRALSLVPEANRLFMQNVMAMYGTRGGGFFDMVWDGPLARPQAELLAARVSALNECFY